MLPPSPFRALTAFSELDAEVFHGRGGEAEQLVPEVAAGRWTTLVGPSGCGKSSLVLAGVLPLLRDKGFRPVVLRPGSGGTSVSALADALLGLLEPGLDETLRLARLHELSALLTVPGALADLAARLLVPGRWHRLVIVVDQFEELLARPTADIDALADILFSDNLPAPVRVLTTLRADFLESVLAHPRLGAAVGRRVQTLLPMGRSNCAKPSSRRSRPFREWVSSPTWWTGYWPTPAPLPGPCRCWSSPWTCCGADSAAVS